MKKQILSANQKKLGSLRIFVSLKKVQPSNGDDQPAKNKMEVSAAINIILALSLEIALWCCVKSDEATTTTKVNRRPFVIAVIFYSYTVAIR